MDGLFACYQLNGPENTAPTAEPRAQTSRRSEQKKWKDIRIEGFAFQIPGSFDVKLKGGIDSSAWTYTGDDIQFFVTTGSESRKPDLYEKSLNSYHSEYLWINSLWTLAWHFPDDRTDYPFVSAARFTLNEKSEGDKITIYVRGSKESSREIADKIFYSVKLQGR